MLTSDDDREIRRRYQSGQTYSELAELLYLDPNTVRRANLRAGGASRSRGPRDVFEDRMPLVRKLARQLADGRISNKEFCARVGCTRPTSYKLLRRVGVAC